MARSFAACVAGWLALLAGDARAERLPWQRFTSASGLAGDAVRDLFLDSRGFLWIATSSGVSRFDGREFRNYDTSEGLPSPRRWWVWCSRRGSSECWGRSTR